MLTLQRFQRKIAIQNRMKLNRFKRKKKNQNLQQMQKQLCHRKIPVPWAMRKFKVSFRKKAWHRAWWTSRNFLTIFISYLIFILFHLPNRLGSSHLFRCLRNFTFIISYLVSANCNQLRYVLDMSNSHPYFVVSMTLILSSLLLQVIVGLVLLYSNRWEFISKLFYLE